MTDFPERAKRVGVIANEHAAAADKEGRLVDAVVTALHQEGLYGMWVPRVLGGAELSPVESLHVIENVA
jgi:alkylation response protein AidB-like acyl-CoA dehydrogenase